MTKVPKSKIKEVNQLIQLAIQSAKDEIETAAKQMPDDERLTYSDLISINYNDGRPSYDTSIDYGAEWRIGSNFEDGVSTLIFKVNEKSWFLREPLNGTDRAISHEEAKRQAAGFFQGYFLG